jgi:hypothetical protein
VKNEKVITHLIRMTQLSSRSAGVPPGATLAGFNNQISVTMIIDY